MLWTYVIWMRIRNHLCPESRKKLSSKTEGTGSDTCAHLKLQGSSVPGGAHSPPAEARRQRTSAGRTASSHLRCRRRHGTVGETEGILAQLAPTGSRRKQKTWLERSTKARPQQLFNPEIRTDHTEHVNSFKFNFPEIDISIYLILWKAFPETSFNI